MKLRMLVDKEILPNVKVYKGGYYAVDRIVVDSYRIKIPMQNKNKFRYALIKDSEGELVD